LLAFADMPIDGPDQLHLQQQRRQSPWVGELEASFFCIGYRRLTRFASRKAKNGGEFI
jgi:hypothetical protein